MKKIFLISAFLFIAANSPADDNFREKEINFIQKLYESGRYFDCIAETGKLYPYEKKPDAEYFIYSNYYLAGQYATVIKNYSPDFSSAEMQLKSNLLLSGSFLKKGMYAESYETLKNIEYDILPEKYIFALFLGRVEPLILSGKMDLIDKEITKSEIYLKDTYNFIKLREELLSYRKDSLISPFHTAAMSAIVPGLGQLYAGFPGEGLISLLSVAATAAGGLYMKDAGRKSFSYTLLFFSGLFYAGNIYGGYNSAEYRNDEEMQNRYRSITSNYGPYNPGYFIDIKSVFN